MPWQHWASSTELAVFFLCQSASPGGASCTGPAHKQQGVCVWYLAESRAGCCSPGTACLPLRERQAQWSWARPRCFWAWLHVLRWELGRGMCVKRCSGSCGRQLAPGGGQDVCSWARFPAANTRRLVSTARVRVCSQGSKGGNLPSSLLSPPPQRHLQWDCFQWVVSALLSQSPEHCRVTLSVTDPRGQQLPNPVGELAL